MTNEWDSLHLLPLPDHPFDGRYNTAAAATCPKNERPLSLPMDPRVKHTLPPPGNTTVVCIRRRSRQWPTNSRCYLPHLLTPSCQAAHNDTAPRRAGCVGSRPPSSGFIHPSTPSPRAPAPSSSRHIRLCPFPPSCCCCRSPVHHPPLSPLPPGPSFHDCSILPSSMFPVSSLIVSKAVVNQ